MNDEATGATRGTRGTEAGSGTATIAYEQEVRFAVVMYGGVSLAIYINGVAQELLRLVRATAPRDPRGIEDGDPLIATAALSEVEKLYRRLGEILGGDTQPDEIAPHDGKIRTRFVVDVISGTSAGGINGVFLAAALAGHRDMARLRDLWITEGEMSKLLNDAYSVGDLDGKKPDVRHPKSLLNSRRMYVKLLDALDGMEPFTPKPDGEESRLVDELDLFVTATDLKGLIVKLRLADRIVYERRYRNVFHFVHATKHGSGAMRNDFCPANNPFLAFAARCTSSFPFAFEPMTLGQGKEMLGARGRDHDVLDAMANVWPRFYRDYLPAQRGREGDTPVLAFEERPFGDGGYLDNKPFGHAISALRARRTDLPIRRKLVYVEPSPEHPELDHDTIEPPDAIENLLLASSSLPRQETIREDLERILDRNRQVEHFQRATRSVGLDFRLPRGDEGLGGGLRDWQNRWLKDVLEKPPAPGLPSYGGGYGSYHRLKVAEVTSELADGITRIVGLDEDSDEALAVRFLVSAWRQWKYQENPNPKLPDARPENEFLMKFDLSYRMRRIRFIQDRIQMFVLDPRHAPDALRVTEGDGADDLWNRHAADHDEVRRLLRRLSGSLAQVQTDLRRVGRELRNPSLREGTSKDSIQNELIDLGIGWNQLKEILNEPDPRSRTVAARRSLGLDTEGIRIVDNTRPLRRVDKILDRIATELGVAFQKATDAVTAVLHPTVETPDEASEELFPRVRHSLWHQYRRFDYMDMMLFPMMVGTDVGELCEVEVLRISPEDATRLIEERNPRTHSLIRSKLAGTRLGNFGAFLDPTWRRSDILWGRLDAAERIVRGCLAAATSTTAAGSVAAEAERLLGRLHGAIVCEELAGLGLHEAREVFVEALLHTRNGDADTAAMKQLLDRLRPDITDPETLEKLERGAVLDLYRKRSRENRSLDREKQVRLASRATEVLGRMLDGLSDRYWILKKRFTGALVFGGRILSGLLEITVPRSVWELMGVYWLNLLYAFEAVLILGGQFLQKPNHDLRDFGLMLLGLTASVDFARRVLRLYLSRRSYLKAAGVVLFVIVTTVFGVGVMRTMALVKEKAAWLNQANNGQNLVWVLVTVFAVIILSRMIDDWIEMFAARQLARREKAEREEREKRRKAAAEAVGAHGVFVAGRAAEPPSPGGAPVAPPGHRS